MKKADYSRTWKVLDTEYLIKSETEVQARIDSVWTHFFTPGDISKYDADGEKWGEPQYAADANEILHKVTSKDGKATGVYNLYDDSTRLITFVPNEEVHWYSDSKEDRALAREYVQRLWDVEPPTGKWRCYVGMVYFLSMLHVSGNFSL